MKIFQVQIVITDEKGTQNEEKIKDLFNAVIVHGKDFNELGLVGHVAEVVRDTEQEED